MPGNGSAERIDAQLRFLNPHGGLAAGQLGLGCLLLLLRVLQGDSGLFQVHARAEGQWFPSAGSVS